MNRLLEELKNDVYFDRLLVELNNYWKQESDLRTKFLNDITPDDKAEFINGEIVVHSPAMARHNKVSRRLTGLMTKNLIEHPVGELMYEKAMIHLTRNNYEPDIVFFISEKAASFTPKQVLFPAPDFVVEILSEDSIKRDREIKFKDYERHGITEYWIIDPEKETIDQYLLVEESYKLNGIFSGSQKITSTVMVGFECLAQAVFDEEAFREQWRS